MNSKFDLSYAEKQLVFDIRRNYDTYSSKFKSATSEQDKCKLLIINPAYAAFFTDPEPKTIKSFGWVFRKYFRLQQGDVPDHVKDVVIKSDPRWIGYMDELNIKHQLSIAKKHPSLVYKWPDLFSLKVLNKIDSGYKVCLDT